MNTPNTILLLLLTLLVAQAPLRAGDDETAAYYKANMDEWVGKNIDLDVVTMRVLQADVGEGFFAFAVWTWNDDTDSSGGGIAVVAPIDKKDSLLRKYGTSAEWDGRRNPETKSLRGMLASTPNPRNVGGSIAYIDMTDGDFEPNEVFGNVAKINDSKRRVLR